MFKVLLRPGHNMAENGGHEKPPSMERQPKPCPSECGSSPLSAALHGETPGRTGAGRPPSCPWGRPTCCGQAAGSAPGPQAQCSPALICLEFSNKETCGREEGGREGYRGGRRSGRMIQPPSPATRGQAGEGGKEEGTRLWLSQEPGQGVQRGLPGLTQTAHLLPCSWGRGRGSPGSREGSGGKPAPTLAPSLPSRRFLRESRQTLSPRPGKMPCSQLPSCSLPVGAAGSLEPGHRGGRGTGGQTLPSPGSPSLAQEIRGYFISQSHVLGMKGR